MLTGRWVWYGPLLMVACAGDLFVAEILDCEMDGRSNYIACVEADYLGVCRAVLMTDLRLLCIVTKRRGSYLNLLAFFGECNLPRFSERSD
jgi:hypothetical protein